MSASALPAEWKEEILDAASDRFERRLAVDMSELRVEMSAIRLDLRSALHQDLTGLRQELAASRVELLKWSFVFWIGQVAAMAGLLAFILHGR